MNRLNGSTRDGVLKLLDKSDGAVGIELGVAAGGFSERMVKSGRFKTFFGVDMYADGHDINQYKTALQKVGLFEPYKLLRMTFDEAFDLFDDESLDFVYIDGYAHSGQEGGETIWKWASKVRVGGVIAGDDYAPEWPLVVRAVDQFIGDTGFALHTTTVCEPEVEYSDFPSWATVKTASFSGTAPSELVSIGKEAARRVEQKRARTRPLEQLVKRTLPDTTLDKLREWNRSRKANRVK